MIIDNFFSDLVRGRATRARAFSLKLVVPFAFLFACSVDEAPLDRVFTCSATSPNTCGSNTAGAPLTCFAGSQLGGSDYCAEPCTPGMSTAQGAVCLGTGALAPTCQPSLDNCPPGFACLRTDVLSDQGVCIFSDGGPDRAANPLCSSDADCTAVAVRSTCGATLLRQIYGQQPGMNADHLYCLQAQCSTLGTSCAQGEVCLPKVIPATSHPPDICVPQCDQNFGCPPNSFCIREVSGPGSVSVCIPGLMGFRCTSDLECMLGTCVDTGAGYSICSQPCTDDDQCAIFDGNRGPYFCTQDANGPGKHCRSPAAFLGANCIANEQCPPSMVCQKHFPFRDPVQGIGECRVPCPDSGLCPTRGGIPHVCLEGDDKRACFPGQFGVQCAAGDLCVPGLSCSQTQLLDKEGTPIIRSLCTMPCATDADCTARSLGNGGAFCSGTHCVQRVGPGWGCSEDKHCGSRQCIPSNRPTDPPGKKRCL